MTGGVWAQREGGEKREMLFVEVCFLWVRNALCLLDAMLHKNIVLMG